MKTLIIIPAFNEEENIIHLINKIRNISNSHKYDILVINDKSKDKTSDICKGLGVNIIDLPCNLGIGGAVQTGYKYAQKNNYDIAIQVDGDGQHNPKYLDDLIKPIEESEADMVIGSRFIKFAGFQSSALRRIGIRYLKTLINILSREKITDPTSGFRAVNRKIIDIFAEYYPRDYPEPESIMVIKRKMLTVKEIPVIMNERESGISSINFTRSIYYMIKVTLAIVFDKMRKDYV